MSKLSIVMPVYNGVKFLERSIESILQQTYKDFNLIIVDDSSTDNSVNICKEYQKKDNRIRIVVANENKGSFHSNISLFSYMLNDYVMCIDQDDWYESNAAEMVMDIIGKSNPDILVFDYYLNESKNSDSKILESEFENIDGMNELMKDESIKSYFWNKVYKKNIFIKGMEVKLNDRDVFDDFVQMPFIFLYANKIVTISKCLYHYYVNPESYSLSTKKSELHYYLGKSYWYRVAFLRNYYNESIDKSYVLYKAFTNSLGAWKELLLDKNYKLAKNLRKCMKKEIGYLNMSGLSIIKKILIRLLTII